MSLKEYIKRAKSQKEIDDLLEKGKSFDASTKTINKWNREADARLKTLRESKNEKTKSKSQSADKSGKK
jgi:HD-like signal output (HDOD) protein